MLGATKEAHIPLPDYGRPPVSEVVLSVQFDELSQFAVPHVGLLWEKYRDAFPITEQKPPLNTQFEKFDVQPEPTVQLQLLSEPHMPRCWFHNEERTELIQVQKDRFIFNWRRGEQESEYPRYPVVRQKFEEHFQKFEQFIDELSLGRIRPNQCEVTYVNHLFWEEEVGHGAAAAKIFPMVSGRNSDSFLPDPEEIHLRWVYRLTNADGQAIGRLHISAEPRIRTTDRVPLYRLSLTARGEPFHDDKEGVFAFFDFGRKQVVRAFTSITSSELHSLWERKDAG